MPAVSTRLVLKFWLPVFFYAILIFVLSGIPGDSLPSRVLDFDELLHIGEYLLFGVLLCRAIRATFVQLEVKGLYWMTVSAVLFYALSDEFHQMFVPLRTASGWDVLSDTVGGFLGAVLLVRITR
ncbi:MAG: VanZ family protein [Candidatus Omnitrophota bacterium]